MVDKDGGIASLQRRIFSAMTAISVVAVLISVVVVSIASRSFVVEDAHEQLARECTVVGSMVDGASDPVATLSAIDFGVARVTLLSADGVVLYDNKADAGEMGNHADRPEVAQAVREGAGASERQSETMGYVSIYEAVRLQNGDVVRLAEDRAGVLALLWSSAGTVALILVALVTLSWFASRALSRYLTKPILDIDPSQPGAEAPYRELVPLVSHLRSQQNQLEQQMEQLRDADLVRQEFTANVTHELKTPIASIMGASELLRDGIVRPEDVQDFATRIYAEARRLSALVSDILTLSKMDESERTDDGTMLGSVQRVDLFTAACEACDRLEDQAEAARVMVTLDGDPVTIFGRPRLIDELVGNLIENAIRYNRMGGSVAVTVNKNDEGCPFLRVKDTGVGIPEEDQTKIFERFYRVDKSRSRASGGTGLGLAIVKHVAKLHQAKINLQSVEGQGTTVTVTFPAQ